MSDDSDIPKDPSEEGVESAAEESSEVSDGAAIEESAEAGEVASEEGVEPDAKPAKKPSVNKNKSRAQESRDRYLDMIQRERAMLLDEGVSRTVEQMMEMAGAASLSDQKDEEDEVKRDATGDQLRAIIPVQSWLPLNIHLVALSDGVFRIAPMDELTERQLEVLKSTAIRSGLHVEEIEVEMWDRKELTDTIRSVSDLSADRCEKTLSQWLADPDNGLLLNQFRRDMMAEAQQMRVSDIHLLQDNAPGVPNWIQYRVDGDVTPMHLLPAETMARLTTLIKREAGLNFGDRTTPKDGRFSFSYQGRQVDVRVAAGPQAQDGEKITLRLLDRAKLIPFDIMFKRHPDVGTHLDKMLAPEIKGGGGMMILSGPTGSGKSTTLYACLQHIDRRRRHVLTIEDPIEYELRYATQWQVRHAMEGGAFADLVKAAMRHDPDYIVIGELRDNDTVETSLKAAESGHTVLTTVHADTALQTFERMKSLMPIEKERASTFTLAQQVRCIMNQRLVKTLCQSCSTKVKASEVMTHDELEEIKIDPGAMVRLKSPTGCELCNHTGISGRTLLIDALMISLSPSERNPIFEALMSNVNNIIGLDGVEIFTRREGLVDLVLSGLVDPKSAVTYLDS